MEGATSEKWARLRFAIVGPLLVSPPPEGGLKAELERLSRRSWDHPSGTGQVRFAASTIERWYYEARAKQNPVAAPGRKTRSDKGGALSPTLIEALHEQHRAHPSWSAQLHWDNLAVLVAADPSLGPMPSYATLVRAMRRRGLTRKRRSKWFEDTDLPRFPSTVGTTSLISVGQTVPRATGEASIPMRQPSSAKGSRHASVADGSADCTTIPGMAAFRSAPTASRP